MQTALAHQIQLEVKAAFKEEQLCTRTNEHNFPLSVLIILQSTPEGCHAPVHHQKYHTIFTSYSKRSCKSPRLTSAGSTRTDLLIRKSSPNSQQKSHLGAPSVPDENIAQNQNSSIKEVQATLTTLNKLPEIKTMLPTELLKYRAKIPGDASLNLLLLSLAVWHQRQLVLFPNVKITQYNVNINTAAEINVLSRCSILKRWNVVYVYCSPENEIREKQNKTKQSNIPGIFIAEHFPRSTCKKPTTMEPLFWKATLGTLQNASRIFFHLHSRNY